MGKVVIVSPDIIGKNMAGPGIRYWNFAIELAKHNSIVLFVPNKECELEADFQIETVTVSILKRHIRDADVIIIQGMALWEYPFIRRSKAAIVVDLYDPFIFENMEVFKGSNMEGLLHQATLGVLIDQLRTGDYFICASEKQKDMWIGMLAAVNRVNPIEYERSQDLSALIGVVPFGLESEEPKHSHAVIKGVVPGITADDKVVLWGGGIWPWLDPASAIRAIDHLAKKHDNIKLFFMGIKHPNPDVQMTKVVEDTIALSDSLSLTGRFVFFNDWVPYQERYNYYLEADIGLSLHFNHLETRFSFRTRMLDYFRCKLPIICTSGDILSDLIIKNNLGRVIAPEDYVALANEIELMLSNTEFAENYTLLYKEMAWAKCVEPLVKFCESPQFSDGKSSGKSSIRYTRIRYYLSKSMHYIQEGKFRYVAKKLFNRIMK